MKHIVFDLDGVLWRGSSPLPGASESLAALTNAGLELVFATNNSTRSPEMVAAKIEDMTGFVADPGSIFTSAMAAASMLSPEDSPVLVVGAEALSQAIEDRNLKTTTNPSDAKSVVVGLTREFTYHQMADASHAVRAGSRFVATNVDPTFPTASGFDPGAGAVVAAIATAAGRTPEIAGKPHAPMAELLRARGISSAWLIGDRIDTDIQLARNSGWQSVLVLTGVAERNDSNNEIADWVVDDVRQATELVLAAGHES